MVEIQEVRAFLNNLSDQRLSDRTIDLQIQAANTKVINNRGAGVSDDSFNTAVLVYASYLSYFAYTTKIERTVGTVPTAMKDYLDHLKILAEEFLSIVRRGNVAPIPPVATTDSLEEDVTFPPPRPFESENDVG